MTYDFESSKTATFRGAQELRALVNRHYPTLFEEVEQNFDTPVSPKTLRINRSDAIDLALTNVANKLEDQRVTYEEVAMEVAAQYREYMENPKLLESHRAARMK